MTFIISGVLSFLMSYRYFSLFVITFFAAFILPLPSNLSVMTASSFVTQGFFNLYFVIIVALAGNILGDLAMYALARFYGRRALEKISYFRKIFNSSKYEDYVERIHKYAPITIIVSRFVTEVNPLVNIIAGVLPIPFFKFLKYELLGEVLDVSAFVFVGYFLSSQGLSATQTTVLLLLSVIGIWLVITLIRKLRNR